MAAYIGFRDGGKTNEEGLHKELSRLFTGGNPITSTPSSMQVVQRAAGANLSVDVSIGDIHILNPAGTYSYWGWTDAATNVTVTAADPTNTRIDVVYAYVDLTTVSSASNNNPGALKFGVYAGTPSGTPLAPSDSAIQTLLGASTPFLKLATITLTAGLANITNIVISDVRTSLALKVSTGATATSGWNNLLSLPNAVVANGNGSYTLTFPGVDITGSVSAGMRLRTTRTVAAPTQCTSLNGTTQSYSKTTPAGMTFTNNFVVSAWIKLSSYPTAASGVISRYNGTSGWFLFVDTTGQVVLRATNGGAGNLSQVVTNTTIPLNKWVHIAAQLDMASFTATTTTSYVMFNGVDIACTVARSGTNPTALVQAGNLEIGSYNGGGFFPGKIAQAAIYGAKVTQATISASKDQSLAGTETNLISAYSFNNTVNDLNTTNANNLTANGSAVATNADSPYGGQAGGTISSSLDYGIVQSASFSTNTTLIVQVAEGCTIPTSGGVAAVAYSSVKTPYGFPGDSDKFSLKVILATTLSGATTGVFNNPGSYQLPAPIGSWNATGSLAYNNTAGGDLTIGISTSPTAATDPETTVRVFVNSGTVNLNKVPITKKYRFAAITSIYMIGKSSSAWDLRGDMSTPHMAYIEIENAYL